MRDGKLNNGGELKRHKSWRSAAKLNRREVCHLGGDAVIDERSGKTCADFEGHGGEIKVRGVKLWRNCDSLIRHI